MSALRAERAEKDSLLRQQIQEMSDQMASLSHIIRDVEQDMRAQDVVFLKVCRSLKSPDEFSLFCHNHQVALKEPEGPKNTQVYTTFKRVKSYI